MRKSLYLIDGHAQTYRAYYAMEGLKGPDGQPTGAVFGFTRVLRELMGKRKPDHLVVVFDAPGPTFRHEAYKEYKATRKPTPHELLDQIPVIQEVVAAFNIPVFMLSGVEADDVLGTLARQGTAADLDVVLVSADKDLCQLLNENVSMFDPRRNETTTAASFLEKRGIVPTLLPDAMGLWGDASDNIPGVPGIGEKGSMQLIAKYGTLDELLAKAGEIKGKRGENLREFTEQALLSRRLATIDCETPVSLDLDACVLHEPNAPRLIELFDQLGFDSIKREMGLAKKAPSAAERDYHLVNTPADFASFMAKLREQTFIAFDVETTSVEPLQAELVGMSFSWAAEQGYYLPFRAPEGEATLGGDDLAAVAEVLTDGAIKKTGHNLKYDALVMRRSGVELRGIAFDSMLASHLLAGHLRGHSLDATAERLLHLTTIHIETVIGKGRGQITMDQVPLKTVMPYAAEDADVSLRLAEKLGEQMDETQRSIFDEIEVPLSLVLTDMQERGVRLDAPVLARMSADMEQQIEGLTEEIHYLAGKEFNIASTKQLADVLFTDLDLEPVRKTKTGFSTDEKVLHALVSQLRAEDHPKKALPKLLLDYRAYTKLKSTYLDALPEQVHPETGRIHTTFHQTGTATGRLSSSNPNLQNIPVRTAEGRGIRAAFVPQAGWTMLAADYSQVELRLLAHLSGDEALSQAFRDGKDIHAAVAAQVFDVSEEEVTADQRRSAKAVNFGIVYGQSAFGLSQATDMHIGAAQEFIDAYFAGFPKVKEFLDACIADARDRGFVETIKGRRRELIDITSSNHMKRQAAERMAANTCVQGSAADLIKIAMINLHRRLREEKMSAAMLLQIHDELLFECPPDELDALQALVREEMENALPLDVPIKVDMGSGANWLEAK